ncbi:MAG: 5-(carboxyamino)imidazole ribonucleotide synthase [Flavobacteriales bacterium]|nr:5-(carboxyamino)imidazole ribonucleotide synthase [Flavobacteriales bacterium]
MAKPPVIALLGGGQLGRMFIENAMRYDVQVSVLDPDPNAPCAPVASRFVKGDYRDAADVLSFACDADVVGIEIEHVSLEALEELKRRGKRVIPDPSVLRIIQDKGLQKQFYADNGVPTAPFALIGDRKDIAAHPGLLPGFLKLRHGGYDGKGVMPIDDISQEADAFDAPSVLEERAETAMELAVLVVRATNGTEVAYDPVEMVFDPRYNLVDHLRAPARIPQHVAEAARRLAKRVAQAFGEPGLYAVEMFLTKDDELLVNETAPRAHNSGHHTIEASASSQFDQLLRVYMDWPLGDTTQHGHAAMINLVGEGGTGAPAMRGLNDILHLPGAFLHLYGKKETRSGRKMGHVTVVSGDQASLDQALAVIKVHGRIVPDAAHEHKT